MEISYPHDGREGHGYLVLPESGRGPGVIVIQEWWGLNANIRDIADRLAGAGFVALAPDLYEGRVVVAPDQAERLYMELNISDTREHLRAAAQYLLAHQATTSTKVGVIGFCLGGQLALFAAANDPDLYAAVVDFYGVHPKVEPDWRSLRAPVLALFAGHDEYISPEDVQEVARRLDMSGVDHEVHVYDDASHAFFNDRDTTYDPDVAADAWRRTLDWLSMYVPARGAA